MTKTIIAKCIACGMPRTIAAGEIPEGETPMCDVCFAPMVAEKAVVKE